MTSDTRTKPMVAMRETMMRAEVGYEKYGEDPTVNALCPRVTDHANIAAVCRGE